MEPVISVKKKNPPRERGRWLRSIQKRPIEWLWKPFLQRKSINLITGDPKTGKSTLVCELAAALSKGRPLPGETGQRSPLKVWLLNGEDYAEDTIAWRLDNQGADPDKVLITDIGETLQGKEIAEITREIKEKQIDVAIIDPIQAWMGADLDMHRANETRTWFGMFRAAAIATDCTFIFVRHRRKGGPDQEGSLQSGLGSIDISGIARSELSTTKRKDGTCTLHRLGGNVGLTGGGWHYTIQLEGPENGDHGVLRWGEETKAPTERGSTVPKRLGKALEWLEALLIPGPRKVSDIVEMAAKLEISDTTLQRAKKKLADAYQEGGIWFWSLKKPEHKVVGVKK